MVVAAAAAGASAARAGVSRMQPRVAEDVRGVDVPDEAEGVRAREAHSSKHGNVEAAPLAAHAGVVLVVEAAVRGLHVEDDEERHWGGAGCDDQ